jgi:CheY-like chemotaxis protein
LIALRLWRSTIGWASLAQAAALESDKARHPDLAVFDIMMPRVDGFAVLKAWREARQPSDFFRRLREVGALGRVFPEIDRLVAAHQRVVP